MRSLSLPKERIIIVFHQRDLGSDYITPETILHQMFVLLLLLLLLAVLLLL
jgi:hypothetical protein